MALPINIEDLINGNTIEWERIEFKEGWNPEATIHTICAFANDLHNWGGGYIIVGIKENKGKPILPPLGLNEHNLDKIQKEIIELGHKIQPNYFPIIQPYILQDQYILVLWCPAGDHRPYTAPTTLGEKSQRQPYIRIGSETIIAKDENLRQLMELTARIPFDDRINNQASINDFDLGLIQAYLQEIGSELYTESVRMSLSDLARAMHIAKGPQEDLRPINVGLLFFSQTPEKFFPRSWVELVWHKDDSGQQFEEHYFKGPIQHQLKNTLSFIQTNILSEKVVKQKDVAEALRFYNFPYTAIEEALSNAIYHKSYERQSPVEVQIWSDKIEILSFPGPIPPVDAKTLKNKRRIVAREYRNRRIGDFLKELSLTEGRGTGFPAIYNALELNGSPKPLFETDEDSTYFLTTIRAHKLADTSFVKATIVSNKMIFNSLEDLINYANGATHQESVGVSVGAANGSANGSANGATNGVTNGATNGALAILNQEVHNRVKEVLSLLQNRMFRSELFEKMGITNQSYNREKYLDPLFDLGWIAMEFPDKKTNPNQTYKITELGKRILSLLNN